MKTLLWADHDTDFTSIGQRFLIRSGFDVVTVADALACLQQLKARIPDILILDDEILWGGRDGVQTWLREEAPEPEQPLTLLTGEDWPKAVSERTGIPAARCLRKPYRLATVVEVVAAERERRRSASSEIQELILEGA